VSPKAPIEPIMFTSLRSPSTLWACGSCGTLFNRPGRIIDQNWSPQDQARDCCAEKYCEKHDVVYGKRLKARIARLRKAEASARKRAENLENELAVRQMAEDADIAAGRLTILHG